MRKSIPFVVLPITAAVVQICLAAPALLGQISAVSDLEEEFRTLIVSSQKYVVTVIAKSSAIYFEETVQATDSKSDAKPIIKPVNQKNIGSGLVADSRGIVLTRKSVIDGMESISVVLHSGESVDAELLGIDDSSQIAVLRIPGMQIRNPSFAHDRGLQSGNWVFVLGNSVGMGPAVSVGLVEGMLEDERAVVGARAWRGCSGAPVFNLSGQVLGILAARMEISDKIPGLEEMVDHDEYVVIPIHTFLPSIAGIADPKVEPEGWIGIDVGPDPRGRFQVTHIYEDSPAAQAGIEVGDQVLSLNDKPIQNGNDLRGVAKIVHQSQIDDSVKLELKRGNAVFQTSVKIKLRSPAYLPKQTANR